MPLQAADKYWCALVRAPEVGAVTAGRLLEYFGNVEAIFAAGRGTWQKLGCKPRAVDWLAQPDWSAVEADLRWLEHPQHHLIHCFDPRWPSQLLEVPGAPIALYAVGDMDLLRLPQLAIVGSRNPSTAGRDAAREFARHLASQGLVITSGLALGIDAAAHEGALQAGDANVGSTIAVCGTGLDQVYPRRNQALAQQIVEQGLVVSEFPIGTPVVAHNFPKRNRIISALSLGTLVVEAAIRSGSLITARLATEQGREVFAMPGSIHNPLARGCHQLIRDGAKLVENAEHILEELAPQLASAGQALAASLNSEVEQVANSPSEDEGLMQYLEFDPLSVDQLINRSGLTAESVSSMLVMLELEGKVVKTATGEYIRR